MSLWIYKKDKDGKRRLYWVGFNLPIILIVLGLLFALVAPRIIQKSGFAKPAAARAQIELFNKALEQFKNDIGRYPTSTEGLNALIQNSNIKSWNEPYLIRKAIPNDPWNRPYNYVSPGTHGDYDLWSYGADGLRGGKAENKDINSWELDTLKKE